MNYAKVNKALKDEFGKGQVKVNRAAPGADWEYTLWFLEDNPSEETIRRAEIVVNNICPSQWYPEKMFHSDKTPHERVLDKE
jgi:hypothetical protein